jgi:hypothetical protein
MEFVLIRIEGVCHRDQESEIDDFSDSFTKSPLI